MGMLSLFSSTQDLVVGGGIGCYKIYMNVVDILYPMRTESQTSSTMREPVHASSEFERKGLVERI